LETLSDTFPAAEEKPVALPAPEPNASESAASAALSAVPAGPGVLESASEPPGPSPAKARAPLLIDVVSQSVGIADMAGIFVPLIPRNTKLPAKMSQVFTTAMDNQEAIRISVFQGEERLVKDKVKLGEFSLPGIERAPRGVPQILVSFNIDQSGLFTVSAKDLKTNAAKEILLEGVKL
jgi:molecular chaperone DnaK